MVVKTVSNKTESCENETVAEESVNNLSFLQELKHIDKQMVTKTKEKKHLIKQMYVIITKKHKKYYLFTKIYL